MNNWWWVCGFSWWVELYVTASLKCHPSLFYSYLDPDLTSVAETEREKGLLYHPKNVIWKIGRKRIVYLYH